jgi:hypothetical protein
MTGVQSAFLEGTQGYRLITEDNDNEDVVLLTQDLFIQIISTTLLSAVADVQ